MAEPNARVLHKRANHYKCARPLLGPGAKKRKELFFIPFPLRLKKLSSSCKYNCFPFFLDCVMMKSSGLLLRRFVRLHGLRKILKKLEVALQHRPALLWMHAAYGGFLPLGKLSHYRIDTFFSRSGKH